MEVTPETTTTTTTTPPKTKTTKVYAVMTHVGEDKTFAIQYLDATTKTELAKAIASMPEGWTLQSVFKGKKLVVKTSFSIN